MAKLIKKIDGQKAYIGILTPEEIKEANKLQSYIQEVIPKLEEKLNEKYKQNKKRKVFYAHEFGTELKKIVDQFEVNGLQRKDFWKQIRDFASTDKNSPKDRSDIRTIYEYYYDLANYDINLVKNVNWSEWSQLFDTKVVRSEERFISWLLDKSNTVKIERDAFRLMLTGVRIFMEGKDSTVYSDEQIFEKYNMIYDITLNWFKYYDIFFTKQDKEPTKARKEKPKKYQQKYFNEVYDVNKKSNGKQLDMTCKSVFIKIYNIDK